MPNSKDKLLHQPNSGNQHKETEHVNTAGYNYNILKNNLGHDFASTTVFDLQRNLSDSRNAILQQSRHSQGSKFSSSETEAGRNNISMLKYPVFASCCLILVSLVSAGLRFFVCLHFSQQAKWEATFLHSLDCPTATYVCAPPSIQHSLPPFLPWPAFKSERLTAGLDSYFDDLLLFSPWMQLLIWLLDNYVLFLQLDHRSYCSYPHILGIQANLLFTKAHWLPRRSSSQDICIGQVQ